MNVYILDRSNKFDFILEKLFELEMLANTFFLTNGLTSKEIEIFCISY